MKVKLNKSKVNSDIILKSGGMNTMALSAFYKVDLGWLACEKISFRIQIKNQQ